MATKAIEKKLVYAIPEHMWSLQDLMTFMNLEREAAVDLLKEAKGTYFQHNRIYCIHPVAFVAWIEEKLKENAHGQKEEANRATATT